MCGIAGIIARHTEEHHKISLRRMINRLRHRGPDGDGFYYSDHVVMGMTRLSIIDLNGGWQPLYNEDKSLVLIMNGEIYNYLELQEMLKCQR